MRRGRHGDHEHEHVSGDEDDVELASPSDHGIRDGRSRVVWTTGTFAVALILLALQASFVSWARIKAADAAVAAVYMPPVPLPPPTAYEQPRSLPDLPEPVAEVEPAEPVRRPPPPRLQEPPRTAVVQNDMEPPVSSLRGAKQPRQQELVPVDDTPAWARGEPWPLLDPESCDGYFGHGYSQHFDLVPAFGTRLFRCMYHAGSRDSLCDVRNVMIDTSQLALARGGEPIESVLGRQEELEMPDNMYGAFFVEDENGADGQRIELPPQHQTWVTSLNNKLLQSFQTTRSRDCTVWDSTPILLIIRFEYANLFHTATDWYNAFAAVRIYGLKNFKVVFLDGHSGGPMDTTWTAMFKEVTYIKHYGERARVCFDRVIIVPQGYQAPISSGITPTKPCDHVVPMQEFANAVLSSFQLPVMPMQPMKGRCTSSQPFNILFVRRVDYRAHPRHDGKIVKRLHNELQIMAALRTWVSTLPAGGSVIEGIFETMSMHDQLEAVQQACMIVGAHGAGLSHILFAFDDTSVIEIRTPGFVRPHFAAGIRHELMDVATSEPPPSSVVEEAQKIFSQIRRQG